MEHLQNLLGARAGELCAQHALVRAAGRNGEGAGQLRRTWRCAVQVSCRIGRFG